MIKDLSFFLRKGLVRLGVGPLGEPPAELSHCRALLVSSFGCPVLVDAQFPAAVVRLRWMERAMFGACVRRERFVSWKGGVPVESGAWPWGLQGWHGEEYARDGHVGVGVIRAGSRETVFGVRHGGGRVVRDYFEQMAGQARSAFHRRVPEGVMVTLSCFETPMMP